MTLRSIIPLLISTVAFAQGPGPRRGTTQRTPPTTAQLAARQLQRVATYLGLDSAQTSALTGNTGLVNLLSNEEMTLQSNAATLKTDYGTLATQVSATPLSAPGELATIESLLNSNLEQRVAAAGQIVSALQNLGGSLALTSQQTAKLPNLIAMLSRDGGGGGFRGRP